MARNKRSVQNVPQEAVPITVIGQMSALECVDMVVIAGRGCVETVAFTRAAWIMTNAVEGMVRQVGNAFQSGILTVLATLAEKNPATISVYHSASVKLRLEGVV